MINYLLDTNIVFLMFYSSGVSHIRQFLIVDGVQIGILKDSYSELDNLTQRSYGSLEALTLQDSISNSGYFNFESILDEDYINIKELRMNSMSDNPKSKNAKKHDLGFIDAAMLVVSKRTNSTLITLDKRIIKAVSDNHITVNLLNPFPLGFIPVYSQEFEQSSDLDYKTAKEAKRVIDRMRDIGSDPQIIANCQTFFSQNIQDFDLVNS